MSAVPSAELLVIKATSVKRRRPQGEIYVAHARLHSGEWTSAMHLKGTSRLKNFLKNNRVDKKQIDSVIAQLSTTGDVILSNAQDETLLKRVLHPSDKSSGKFRDIWT